jgi:hypothetical protein
MLPLIITTTHNAVKKDRKSKFSATGALILINNEKLKYPR